MKYFKYIFFLNLFFIGSSSLFAQTWMWHPGHLAAYLQQVQREKSASRCVNVGYPGKFYTFTDTVYFKVNGKVIVKPRSQNGIAALFGTPDNVFVSEDGKNWTIPEYDSRYCNEQIRPECDVDSVVTIRPDRIIVLRNSEINGDRIHMYKNSVVLVDFKELEIGSVGLKVAGSGSLTATVGESVDEALNDNPSFFEQYPIKPYNLLNSGMAIDLPERALRYLKISCTEHCVISFVSFNARMRPVKRAMQFECSDSTMNRLFETGVKTIHTSMHNFYLDGVKRDYLPWAMDAIITAIGADRVFSDRQIDRNGLSLSLMPLNPKKSDWGIVDYPLHALIGLKEEYLRYGDISTSLMYRNRIDSQMAFYESMQDSNGFLHALPPSTGFIPGWARKNGPEDYGVATYAQIMLYENFRIAAFFATKWGERSLARHYRRKAEQLEKSIMEHFWDQSQGAFINGIRTNGEVDARISRHAQYWAILADLFPKGHIDTLFSQVLPPIPYYREYISYEKGYELLAYIKAGKTVEAYMLLNDVWGDWLQQGHTRFPENFSLDATVSQQLMFYDRPFGLSLCHGANGVPPIIVALYGIIGFSQDSEGESVYTIRPQLLHLDWARARIPVKEGFIDVYISKTGQYDVSYPKGCKVICLPLNT